MKAGEQPVHFRHKQFWTEKKAQQPPDHRTQIIGARFNFIGFYSSSPENKENILLGVRETKQTKTAATTRAHDPRWSVKGSELLVKN